MLKLNMEENHCHGDEAKTISTY